MRLELEKYGIQMPAFSKIGGILANELSVDEAACKEKWSFILCDYSNQQIRLLFFFFFLNVLVLMPPVVRQYSPSDMPFGRLGKGISSFPDVFFFSFLSGT